MRKMRGTYKMLVWEPEGKRLYVGPRHRREQHNITIHLKDIRCVGVDWICLAIHWQALVNPVMSLSVTKGQGIWLAEWLSASHKELCTMELISYISFHKVHMVHYIFLWSLPFRYHMKTFHDAATAHYEVASQRFHSTLLRSPALMLFSKTDPIGTEESNKKAHENWDKLGLKVSSSQSCQEQDLRFIQKWRIKLRSSGLWQHVVFQ